jgi:hypothetical protein
MALDSPRRLVSRQSQGAEACKILGQFSGKIDSAGAKYAFIDCDQLADHDSKVFVFTQDLKKYQVGEVVKFTAYLDTQGRLKGKDLKSGLHDTTTLPNGDEASQMLGQFSGTIDSAGWKCAFIDCDELKEELAEHGHSKVFLFIDELKGYKVGQVVKFTAYLDPQGRLKGTDLKSGLKETEECQLLGEFLGTIDSAGPKYAFIDCDQLAEHESKVFIFREELKAYKVGQMVKFTAYLDSQGKLKGKDLKSGLKNTKKGDNLKTASAKALMNPAFKTMKRHLKRDRT